MSSSVVNHFKAQERVFVGITANHVELQRTVF